MIWGIIVTISIAVIGFCILPRVWFWICWEVFSSVLVAIGCIGEWHLFRVPSKPGGEDHHRKRELQFIFMVSIGVTMELAAQPHAIREGFRQDKAIEDLRSTNLAQEQDIETLRKENIDGRIVEASLKQRTAEAELKLAEITNNITKIDPRNQLISSISATMKLHIHLNPSHKMPDGRPAATRMKMIGNGFSLFARMEAGGLLDFEQGEINRRWTEDFNGDTVTTVPFKEEIGRFLPTSWDFRQEQVKRIDNIVLLDLQILEYPIDAKIEGEVIIRFNDVDRKFSIPNQQFTNHLVIQPDFRPINR